jgi:hypothetical protein
MMIDKAFLRIINPTLIRGSRRSIALNKISFVSQAQLISYHAIVSRKLPEAKQQFSTNDKVSTTDRTIKKTGPIGVPPHLEFVLEPKRLRRCIKWKHRATGNIGIMASKQINQSVQISWAWDSVVIQVTDISPVGLHCSAVSSVGQSLSLLKYIA